MARKKKEVVVLTALQSDEYSDVIFDATDTQAAFLALFREFKTNQFYDELTEPPAWDESETSKASKERDLFKKADAGDGAAAEKLLRLRRDHEYEGWTMREIQNP